MNHENEVKIGTQKYNAVGIGNTKSTVQDPEGKRESIVKLRYSFVSQKYNAVGTRNTKSTAQDPEGKPELLKLDRDL